MKDLILGIDLCEASSQISYYKESAKDIESIPFWGSTMILKNETLLSQRIEAMNAGNPEAKESLKKHVGELTETALRHTGSDRIAWICVALEQFHTAVLDALEQIFGELGYENRISFISHVESYCHYVVMTRRELWNSGCMLIDFSREGLFFHCLHNSKLKDGTVITVDSARVTDGPVQEVLEGRKTLDECAIYLEKEARGRFEKQIISSVYLTGEIFDTPQIPQNVLDFLCTRRRVFAGQNLYVKGACIAAAVRAKRIDLPEFIFACQHRLTTTIEMDIVEKGVPMRFRIARAGSNWHEATRSFDCILNQCDRIDLRLTNLGAQEGRRENISLEEIPYRGPKATRVEIKFAFMGADRCLVTVRDKGFGDFFKSSGIVIYRELEL